MTTLPQGIELAITYILERLGGKASLDAIHEATKIPKSMLKRYLWYCQRRRLIKRDLGVYYVTNIGLEAVQKNRILTAGGRTMIIVFQDKIELITLGRKSRTRAVRKDIIIDLFTKGQVSRSELRSATNKREILAALRILRILKLVKDRGDMIYISQDGVDKLLMIGIDPNMIANASLKKHKSTGVEVLSQSGTEH